MARYVPLREGERQFKIGLNADCPVHQITCGGQRFPRTSEKVSGYGVETVRSQIRGAVVRMQAGQLERCMEAARYKVIRSTRGKKRRSRVHDTRSRFYRRLDDDVPVTRFLYAYELNAQTDPTQEARFPTFADADATPKAPPAAELVDAGVEPAAAPTPSAPDPQATRSKRPRKRK